jgi:hypothetical protein
MRVIKSKWGKLGQNGQIMQNRKYEQDFKIIIVVYIQGHMHVSMALLKQTKCMIIYIAIANIDIKWLTSFKTSISQSDFCINQLSNIPITGDNSDKASKCKINTSHNIIDQPSLIIQMEKKPIKEHDFISYSSILLLIITSLDNIPNYWNNSAY